MLSKHIDFKGMNNLRDLGGMTNVLGKKIKSKFNRTRNALNQWKILNGILHIQSVPLCLICIFSAIHQNNVFSTSC